MLGLHDKWNVEVDVAWTGKLRPCAQPTLGLFKRPILFYDRMLEMAKCVQYCKDALLTSA